MQIFQPSGSLLTPRVQQLVGEILVETSRDDSNPIADYIDMIETSPIVGPAVELKILLALRYFENYANANEEYQEFIRKCFEQMDGSLKLSVAELMCVAPLGYACSEWAPIERDGRWMLESIQIIDPRKYRFRGKRGKIEDLLYVGEYGDVPVPYDRVIHLTNQAYISFGSPYGVAECKRAIAAYKAWKITIAAALIAAKRRGEPILVGYADSQQQVEIGKNQDGTAITVSGPEALMKSLQDLENNSVAATDLANKIESLQAADGGIILSLLKVLETYQLIGFLVPQSIVMATGVGDSNLNTGHRTILDLCVGAKVDQIKERLIEDVVRPLLTWQFGDDVEDFGEFPSPKEQPEGAIDLFNALISAVYNGAFSAADLDVINRMRELAGLPEVAEIAQDLAGAPTDLTGEEEDSPAIDAGSIQFAKGAPKGKGKGNGGKGQKNCNKGINCGGTCISAKKKCKQDSPSETAKAEAKSPKKAKGGGGGGDAAPEADEAALVKAAGNFLSKNAAAKSKIKLMEEEVLSKGEASAIATWISFDEIKLNGQSVSKYALMNQAIYAKGTLPKDLQAKIEATNQLAQAGYAKLPSITKDSMLQAAKDKQSEPFDADAPLQRHMRINAGGVADFVGKYKASIGKNITEDTHFATTYLKDLGWVEAGANVTYKITPKLDGTGQGKYIDGFKNDAIEGEIMYPPGSKFRVKSVFEPSIPDKPKDGADLLDKAEPAYSGLSGPTKTFLQLGAEGKNVETTYEKYKTAKNSAYFLLDDQSKADLDAFVAKVGSSTPEANKNVLDYYQKLEAAKADWRYIIDLEEI